MFWAFLLVHLCLKQILNDFKVFNFFSFPVKFLGRIKNSDFRVYENQFWWNFASSYFICLLLSYKKYFARSLSKVRIFNKKLVHNYKFKVYTDVLSLVNSISLISKWLTSNKITFSTSHSFTRCHFVSDICGILIQRNRHIRY